MGTDMKTRKKPITRDEIWAQRIDLMINRPLMVSAYNLAMWGFEVVQFEKSSFRHMDKDGEALASIMEFDALFDKAVKYYLHKKPVSMSNTAILMKKVLESIDLKIPEQE